MSPPIHLSVFTELRFTNADLEDVTPRGRKARAMIAFLACEPGNSATRDRIIGLLWADRGEEQARNSLRQVLAELKQTAPDVAALVRGDRTTIALEPLWTSDHSQLLSAIAAADPIALATALEGLRGELLADLSGLSDSFDDWRRAEQTRIEQLLEQQGFAMARQQAASQPLLARRLLTSLQRLLGGNEEIVRLGMILDAEGGDIASIHRRYRSLEAVLRRDFDITPSPATKQLLTELAAGHFTKSAQLAAGTSADASSLASKGGAGSAGHTGPVVIVTPFAVLDSDGQCAALANVLCLDLESALVRLPDIRVLRHSGTGSLPREDILRGAIAGYSLTGSVRQSANGIRLAITLADTETARTIWSHQEVASRDRLGETLDLVVSQVAGALLPTVERDLLTTRRLESASPNLYALYLNARATLLTTASLAEAQDAAQTLEQALEEDPHFINALLHLVLCYNTDFLQRSAGHDPLPWRQRAMRLAREAWTLEPDNPDVLARLGWCHLRHHEWDTGREWLHKALNRGCNYADNVQQIGFAMLCLGDIDEGLSLLREAFRLNPFPRSDYFADIAFGLLLQGDPQSAAQQLEIAADRSILYRAIQTACLAHAGERARATTMLAEVCHELAMIWQGKGKPHHTDLVTTMNIFLPLRQDHHRALLLEGWRLAGLKA